MLVPIGPVAIFGASNFPFAFSVAGGDTASALAAGCAVVVKAHPSHPGASELAAKAIIEAARIVGVPTSVFALLNGGAEVGQALVLQAEIAAVGFTGSEAAGRALFNLAASRPRPIPVYAEMGSVNPIFALPGALAERGEAFANAYADSVLLGIGQFCTNPGVLVGIASDDFQRVTSIVADRLTTAGNGTMLNDGIQARFDAAIAERGGPWRVVSGEEFLANPVWHEEVFGPAAVGVACRDFDELVTVARSLTGQLTASVHFADGDPVEELLPELVKIAGRLVANGFPTGVEVCPSMQHGGPYPASTDSRTTSVGTAAISRFARPVAWQGFPDALLPAALRDGNPQGITRLEG